MPVREENRLLHTRKGPVLSVRLRMMPQKAPMAQDAGLTCFLEGIFDICRWAMTRP